MIERIADQVAYNPIREHIKISFEIVAEHDEQIEEITKDLNYQQFDPLKSRAIIFVRTRKIAEEAVEALTECLHTKGYPWASKVDFFHAGLDSIDREKKYEDFETGDTVILITTKAFGMGMDIKNIHFVYHLGPSSTLEDFLQEVGRAGRNRDMLLAAGFSESHPISTKCVMTKDDFRKLQDLQHESAISWNHIKSVQQVIHTYIKKFKLVIPDPANAFPLPFDLINDSPQFDDVFDAEGIFRLALYWLERLGRIKLGLFTPAFLPLSLKDGEPEYRVIQDLEDRNSLQQLVQVLLKYKVEKFPEGTSVIVPMNELRQITGKRTSVELFKFLIMAQKAKALIIDRVIVLEPTKTKTAEMENWKREIALPSIEAVFQLAEKILNSTRLCDQISFSGDYLDSLIKEIAQNSFIPRNVFWKKYKKNKSKEEITVQEICKELYTDFTKKREKFAFRIITMLPRMRHQSVIEAKINRRKPEVVQLIYNGSKSHDEWRKPLKELKQKLLDLIYYVSHDFFDNGIQSFNYAELMIKLKLENHDPDYLQKLLFLSKALGYLKGEGGLIPMGIELFLDDTSEIKEDDRSSKDYQVYQDFLESGQMKELRLLALECLSNLKGVRQDNFIKKYFSCASSAELIELLEENFGEDHDNLKAFRKEALEKAEKDLSDEQKLVYDAPLDTNLQVIAGPGSGKTHTLTLRVAKLIQKEKISSEQILILAYNRAVVVELKDRLNKLFKALGYAKIISRLKVFTFHGFCMNFLDSELDKKDFDSWVPAFLDAIEKRPGKINQRLGQIKYVFVDEFQDITNERLKLLEKIADPQKTKICVIGDPNQSIYGYDRLKEGGVMSPIPYYTHFDRIYQPKILYLSNNYRSYPDILTLSEELLKKNSTRIEIPKLKPVKFPEVESNYCEIINFKQNKVLWKNKLLEILHEKNRQGKKFHQIALMFRSNEEVFRAFNELQSSNLDNARIRIQGNAISPYKSREFFHFLQIFRQQASLLIKPTLIKDFIDEKNKVRERYPVWDVYLLNLFHCLLLEFQYENINDATYQDLVDFIEDVSGKDDGHFSKILNKHIASIDQSVAAREVVLTTMHKVKGVEYDAVIIPPSFSDFPFKEDSVTTDNFQELLEEERRLLYVAYTRAKFRLIVIKYDRELAIDQGNTHRFPDELKQKLGVVVPQNIDKLFISWGAQETTQNSFNTIKNKVSIGDPVELVRDAYNNWSVNWNNIPIARLKKNKISDRLSNGSLYGFNISSIICYTYQESLDYDLRNNTDFTQKFWGRASTERGFIYLIDFSGYGKP